MKNNIIHKIVNENYPNIYSGHSRNILPFREDFTDIMFLVHSLLPVDSRFNDSFATIQSVPTDLLDYLEEDEIPHEEKSDLRYYLCLYYPCGNSGPYSSFARVDVGCITVAERDRLIESYELRVYCLC